jgi:transposase
VSKSNRNEPRRARSSESRYTVFDFDREFPDDAACLEWLVGHLYPDGIFCPKCDRVTKHHRVSKRTCYECQFCGHQEYPMVGTIFEGSATSLKLWFHAFFLMAQTRCGISAKQLERELGVTYKTAYRMFKQIRSLLDQDSDGPLSGTVEMDEAYIGGNPKWMHKNDPRRKKFTGRGTAKQPVFGMAQRKTDLAPGRVMAKVVPDVGARSLLGTAAVKVLPASTVYTDEWAPYEHLEGMGYQHSRVHHAQQVYVDGDVHTNTIEGFWATVKTGIRGVYHGVSVEHLQSYLDEYVFRYNHRHDERGMFSAFLSRIVKVAPVTATS